MLFVFFFAVGWFVSPIIIGVMIAPSSFVSLLVAFAIFLFIGLLLYGMVRESKMAIGGMFVVAVLLTIFFTPIISASTGPTLGFSYALCYAVMWCLGAFVLAETIRIKLLEDGLY